MAVDVHGRQQSEKTIQAKIIQELKRRPNSFTWKAQAGPYSPKGLPDVMHVEGGRLYAIEVKRPGEAVTPLQEDTLRRLREAGAVVGVAQCVEDAMGIVEPVATTPNLGRIAGEIAGDLARRGR